MASSDAKNGKSDILLSPTPTSFIEEVHFSDFKTFRGEHSFKLDSSLSVIYGENGCGKTNIIDNIRFALGENRPSRLRVNRLKDLPFRNNTFSAKKCIVEILIETPDGRRSFSRHFKGRSSIWKVDGRSVTKKEYMRDLAAIGFVLTDHTFVAQGTVTLQTITDDAWRKDEFERGIGTYDIRLEIEELSENLSRISQEAKSVEGMLSQRKVALKQLRKEAETARYKVDLQESMKNLEIQYAFNNLRHQISKLEIIKAEEKVNQDKYEKNEKDLENDHEYSLEVQREITNKKEKIKAKFSEIEKCKKELEKLEQKNQAVLDELRDIRKKGKLCKSEITQANKKLKLQERDLAKITDRFNQVNKSISQQEENYKTETQLLCETTEKLKELRKNENKENTALRKKLTRFQEELRAEEVQKNRLESELELAKSDQNSTEVILEDLSKSLEEGERELPELSDHIQKKKKEIEEARGSFDSTEKEVSTLEKIVKQLQEEIEDLDDKIALVKKGDTTVTIPIPKPVRTLLDELNKKNSSLQNVNFHGLVYQLFRWSGKDEDAVIEALGINALTSPVVETHSDVKIINEWASSKKIGRLRVIPLEILTRWTLPSKELLEKPGVMDFLADRISISKPTDQRLDNLRWLLARNTLLVEDMDVFARIRGQKIRAVTRDGNKLSPEGFYEVGKRLQKILIYRESHEDIINRLKQQREELWTALNGSMKEFNTAMITKKQRYEFHVQKQQELGALRERYRNIEQNREKIQKRISDNNYRLVEAQKKVYEITPKLLDINSNIETLSISIEKAQNLLEAKYASSTTSELESDNQRIQDSLNQVRQEIQNLQEQESKQREKKVVLKESMKKHSEILELRKQEYLSSEKAEKELLESSEVDAEALKNAERELSGQISELDALEEKLSLLEKESSDLDQKIDQKKTNFQKMKSALKSLQRQIRDLELNISRLELQTRGHEDKNLTNSQISHETRRIRDELDRLKDVDTKILGLLYSLEQEFIQEKKSLKKILEKEKELQMLYLKSKNTRKTRIKEKFEEFRERYLALLGETINEPLQFDLSIIWHRDEFEIQVTNQAFSDAARSASGGQTTLMAACFIFALQKMNPSSLYVLDEPSAQLSIKNTENLMKLIKRLSGLSQYILITPDDEILISEANRLVIVSRKDSQLSSQALDFVLE